MQGIAQLIARAHALRDALARSLEPERAEQRALELVCIDMARAVVKRSCCDPAATEPHRSWCGSDHPPATWLPEECGEAYRAWGQVLESDAWHGELDRLCTGAVSADDAPYYAVELLQSRFAAGLRRQRGIYYTPRPIVDYLLASVHELLIDALDMPAGLGALGAGQGERTLALVDPACGAGIFLACALRRAISSVSASARVTASWPTRILQRIAGFEIVPAAAGAARCLLAHEWRRATAPDSGPPHEQPLLQPLLQIWNRSALEPAATPQLDMLRASGAPLVIVGNPPFANFGRANRSPWLLDLMLDYQRNLGERKHNLHDDAIKFLRWAQWHIDRAGSGILALVLNHTFLQGLTHRCLRESLLASFQQLFVLDLHGSSLRPTAGDKRDENVFMVRPGIALLLAVKDGTQRACRVWHAEQTGSREAKLSLLASHHVHTTRWTTLHVRPPHFILAPAPVRKPGIRRYELSPRIDEIFGLYSSGVQTKHDARFTDFARTSLEQRMRSWRQAEGHSDDFDDARLIPFQMAPWDLRWIYYDPALLGRARWAVMQHMLRENLGLVFMRQNTNREYDHVLATRALVSDRVFYSGHGAPFLAPLYIYEGQSAVPNLRPAFQQGLADRLGEVETEQVFAYVYAVLQSASYRREFAGQLNVDFPRVILPQDTRQFQAISTIGRQLLAAHLPAPAPPQQPSGSDGWLIKKGYPRWDGSSSAVYVNEREGFEGITAELWHLRCGGYAVLQRWLAKRRGRALGAAERVYFAWLVEALQKTLDLITPLDSATRALLED